MNDAVLGRVLQDELDRAGKWPDLVRRVPNFAGVLDEDLRFILVTDYLLEITGRSSAEEAIGCRPGDLLDCRIAVEAGDCGISPQCTFCLAHEAFVGSLAQGGDSVFEAAFDTGKGADDPEYRITLRHFRLRGRRLLLLSLVPGIYETRLLATERVFIHDILNSSGSLVSLLRLLAEERERSGSETVFVSMAAEAARRIHREITGFSKFLKADKRELVAEPTPVHPRGIMIDVKGHFTDAMRNGVMIEIGDIGASSIFTDRILLQRILDNMVRNAIEASKPGDTVQMAYEETEKDSVFSVSNPRTMNLEEQSAVFRKGTSTKGPDRGWGTYGMKILGEAVLGGRVDFLSNDSVGTIFRIALPKGRLSE